MEFFLDTASIEEIKFYKTLGLVDGVTTNPALLSEVPLLMPKPLGEPLLPVHLREYLLSNLKRLIVETGFAIQCVWGGNRNIYTSEEKAREVGHIHAIKVE